VQPEPLSRGSSGPRRTPGLKVYQHYYDDLYGVHILGRRRCRLRGLAST
jgi:hypothetical protein